MSARKIKRKVICAKCHKLRIVTYYYEDKQDRQEFLESIKNYVCTDCE